MISFLQKLLGLNGNHVRRCWVFCALSIVMVLALCFSKPVGFIAFSFIAFVFVVLTPVSIFLIKYPFVIILYFSLICFLIWKKAKRNQLFIAVLFLFIAVAASVFQAHLECYDTQICHRNWLIELMEEGVFKTQREVAAAHNYCSEYVKRAMKLLFLSPQDYPAHHFLQYHNTDPAGKLDSL